MWISGVLLLGGVGTLAKLTPEQIRALPPPAAHPVNFTREIQPIFEASCIKCHGRGRDKGGFQVDTRATLLKGGDSGPAVVPGKSVESYLIELVSGADPDNVMPKKGSKLTREQVGLLRAWIDQGLTWDEGVTFSRRPPINLQPRRPQLPASSKPDGAENPIDLLLQPYYASHQIRPAPPVSDRLFARRVYLDVIGLIPSPGEMEEFLADARPDKRARLVQRLLADNARYAEHWLTFWNDALRNDYRGTGYIDGGRKQITDWLYAALAENMPYDRFVAQLINPPPEAEGFIKGIVWRGVVNASQTPQMQAAQNISQIFMGVNLKCASCHDSFINDWTLADSYGLASIYADQDLEMVLCDKPTGRKAVMKFIYPELGNIDAQASKSDRLKQLADVMTQRKNGRLTRTMVNRLWARFMGRGLVEPLDDMETPAWHSDLLDWLAEDLADHGYDLKRTIERILTSQAYQLPATPMSEQQPKEYVFQGPTVRRLSAEQYLDALATVTGAGYTLPVPKTVFAEASQSVAPKWIWKDAHAAEKAEPATVYFRKVVDLPDVPTAATIVITCDNSFKLYVNGKEAGSGRDYTKPALIDVRTHLVKGANVIAVSAVNDPAAPKNAEAEQSSPAGLLLHARIRHEQNTARQAVEKVMDFQSDASWVWSTEKADDWTQSDFSAENWPHAQELGEAGMAPWRVEKAFAELASAAALYGHTRASLVNADPLMTALGRPNREQVITSRTSVATTLQALELTNGGTLAERLKRSAEKLVQGPSQSGRELVVNIFERALARPPTADELHLAADLVGSPVQKEGVEDLLWAMTMLPEFQLIY